MKDKLAHKVVMIGSITGEFREQIEKTVTHLFSVCHVIGGV